MVVQLLKAAIEIEEDTIWAELAAERDTPMPFIFHMKMLGNDLHPYLPSSGGG